eukprot:jgi/Bigna1/75644/fgenesh1_pg.36_\
METYSASAVLYLSLSAGLFHYLNNEVMYLALDKGKSVVIEKNANIPPLASFLSKDIEKSKYTFVVHPVTLAVGNTLKRVFILVASVIIFHTSMSPTSIIGASIAIPGTLVYSLTKQYYDNKAAKAGAAATRGN